DVLKDVHWIGGDPAKEEIYGYASWSPRKGIFSLRNPSSMQKTFKVSLKNVFELPATSSSSFELHNAIDPQDKTSEKKVQSEKTFIVTLAPYELKIWDAIPARD
ncbi:MAG: enterotoxin, partial [Ginsengibacter sp.]